MKLGRSHSSSEFIAQQIASCESRVDPRLARGSSATPKLEPREGQDKIAIAMGIDHDKVFDNASNELRGEI